MSEPELTRDILVTVLEHQNGSLVNLECTIALCAGGVVDIGFLPSADAAIYLRNDVPTEQLEEDHSCPRVKDLFRCCSISFVFLPVALSFTA